MERREGERRVRRVREGEGREEEIESRRMVRKLGRGEDRRKGESGK